MARPGSVLLGSVLLLAAAAPVAARPYLGLEAGYKQGDFGTGITSRQYSVVAQGGWVAEDWDAGFALPFHVLDTEGSDPETGLGDLYLQAGHVLLPETDGGLSAYASGAVKVPTADEEAGLGTGEPDLGGYLTLHQALGAWQVAGYGGYTVRGEPAGVDYNHVTSYGVKASRSLNGAVLFGGLEGSTALADAGDPPLDAFAGGFWILPESRVLTADLSLGLSDGSPDVGLGVGVVQWF